MNEQKISLLIRHIAGSKKGQVEKFSDASTPEIRIGRGLENDVSFDPVKEDTISRDHCRILQDSTNPERFFITDSQSKNGTFVNDVYTTGKTELFAGDIVKLGKEGLPSNLILIRVRSRILKKPVLSIQSLRKKRRCILLLI